MRIGVNVPNELLKEAKQIRPEVNVSQVCREALQQRVELARRIAHAASNGVHDHVTRLDQSVSRPPPEPDWVAYALEDARAWATVVTPEAWERFTYQADFLRKQGRDEAEMVTLWSSEGEGVKGFQRRLAEHDEWLISQYDLQFESDAGPSPRAKAENEYARAWLGYVNEVRRLLEKHRKDEYDRVMAERAEYRQSLPKPELPPQLV